MRCPDFTRPNDTVVIPATEALKQAVRDGGGPLAGIEVKAPASTEELQNGRAMLNEFSKLLPPDLASLASEQRIEGPDGELRMLMVEAESPVAGLLHIHGGGWYAGSPELSLGTLIALSQAANVSIASVDYRLAPEHPYPAAQDDCETAALWWFEQCEVRGLHRVYVAGESAGAHLSAATRQRLWQKHGRRFAGAMLTYGLFDFSNALPSRTVVDGRNLVQDSAMCAFYADNYLPNGVDRTAPDVSPLNAPLADVGSSLLMVGSLDPFYDDSLLMHMRLIGEGNRSYLAIFKDAPHAFELMDPELGQHSVTMMAEFIAASA